MTREFMKQALDAADAAALCGEVPVGAVVVDSISGKVVATGHNRTICDHDPTAHAEIVAMRAAAQRLGTHYLDNCDLYVTLEPCAMCAAAISWARIRRLYFGAYDTKSGGVEHGARIFTNPNCHHVPEIYGGIAETECAKRMTGFFAQQRRNKGQ